MKRVLGFNVQDNKFTFKGKGVNTIKYTYKKAFEFDKISIITDFSNLFKIKRTISLRARTIIAEKMHSKIKQSLSNILVNGTTLNIYDKGPYRYYDIEFSKSSINKINSTTNSVLEASSNLKQINRVLPFLVSKINDNIEVTSICDFVNTFDDIELKYIFGKDVKILKVEAGEIDEETNSYIINLSEAKEGIEIKYKKFDKLCFAKIVLFIIIIIVLFFVIKYKIKKKFQKIKEKQSKKKEEKKIKKLEKKANKKKKGDET